LNIHFADHLTLPQDAATPFATIPAPFCYAPGMNYIAAVLLKKDCLFELYLVMRSGSFN
jgi:hypothetical protein